MAGGFRSCGGPLLGPAPLSGAGAAGARKPPGAVTPTAGAVSLAVTVAGTVVTNAGAVTPAGTVVANVGGAAGGETAEGVVAANAEATELGGGAGTRATGEVTETGGGATTGFGVLGRGAPRDGTGGGAANPGRGGASGSDEVPTATMGAGLTEPRSDAGGSATDAGRGGAGTRIGAATSPCGGYRDTVPAAGIDGLIGGTSASAIVSAASTGVITFALAG
jgi:hypothetical protein